MTWVALFLFAAMPEGIEHEMLIRQSITDCKEMPNIKSFSVK